MATTGSAQEDERVVASPASDCSSACPTPAASEVRRRRGERQETEAQGWSQRAQDEPAGDDTKKSAQDGAGLAAAFQARQFPPLPGTESVDWPRGDFLLACLLCVAGAIFVVAGWRMWTTQGAWEAFPYALLSFFCLCPGVYHLVIFVLIFLKVPGFSFRLLR